MLRYIWNQGTGGKRKIIRIICMSLPTPWSFKDCKIRKQVNKKLARRGHLDQVGEDGRFMFKCILKT
jgi:hypothetical protein